jgi:hypothetical protein
VRKPRYPEGEVVKAFIYTAMFAIFLGSLAIAIATDWHPLAGVCAMWNAMILTGTLVTRRPA